MKDSKIEWCSHTFNGWIGCAHATYTDAAGKEHSHQGCLRCYAEADMDKRRGRVEWGPKGTRSRTSDDYWRQPLKWNRNAENAGVRARVFCASLADVFEDWQGPILDAQGRKLGREPVYGVYSPADGTNLSCATMGDLRRDLFAMIDQTPWLDWLLLTKRPENVRRMWLGSPGAEHAKRNGIKVVGDFYRKNVWLLTSISDQPTTDAMIPPLLECRDLVPVLGVSAEPLLGPVDLRHIHYDGIVEIDSLTGDHGVNRPLAGRSDAAISWVIVGGESGHGARPMDPAWARSLRDQCIAAGVPFFFKQWGEFAPADPMHELADEAVVFRIGPHESIVAHGSVAQHVMLRIGKKSAGRMLDGRLWDEYPQRQAVPT